MNFLNRNALKYGLIMTVLTGLWLMTMHFLGFYDNREDIVNVYDLAFIVVVPLVVWYFGLTEYRKSRGGKLSLKEGILQGFKISLVYGVLSPFAYLKYYLLFNPNLVEFMRQEYGLLDASVSQVYITDMIVQFVSAIIGGTLYGSIISFFLKKS
jgi:hypothetical protein